MKLLDRQGDSGDQQHRQDRRHDDAGSEQGAFRHLCRECAGGAGVTIGRVEPADGMRPILGYMLALVIGTIVVAAVPWISIGFLK